MVQLSNRANRRSSHLSGRQSGMSPRQMRAMFVSLLGAGAVCGAPSVAQCQFTYMPALTTGSVTRVQGSAAGGVLGWETAGIGDFNGDGIGDYAAGAPYANGNRGEACVIFGSATPPGTVDLAALDGTNGLRINGEVAGDFFGWDVARAGDVNNDGFADLLIGSYANDHGHYSGAAYIVFGKSGLSTGTLNIAERITGDAVKFVGASADDRAGISVAAAGDTNGDGIDDVIICAYGRENGGAFVVKGKDSFTTTVELSDFSLSDGLILENAEVSGAGWEVSGAGDFNGDGFDDVIVSALYLNDNGPKSGGAYVVFGAASSANVSFNLSALDGSNGVRIAGGLAANDWEGARVAGGSDINGDGFSDVVLASYNADALGNDNGDAWIVFGRKSSTGGDIPLSLSDPESAVRFVVDGSLPDSNLGCRVSTGDVNGDGFSDLLIGAYTSRYEGQAYGACFLVTGRESFSSSTIILQDANSFTRALYFVGEHINSRFGRGVSIGPDVNGDGLDDMIIGAPQSFAAKGMLYAVFGQPAPLKTSLKLKLNFIEPSADSFALKALLPWGPGHSLANTLVTFSIGGAFCGASLDSEGRFKSDDISVQAKPNPLGIAITAKFDGVPLRVITERMGMLNETVKKVRTDMYISISVDAQGREWRTYVPQTYSAKQGKSGKTK